MIIIGSLALLYFFYWYFLQLINGKFQNFRIQILFFIILLLPFFTLVAGLKRPFSSARYIKINDKQISFCIHKSRLIPQGQYYSNDIFSLITNSYDFFRDNDVFRGEILIDNITDIDIQSQNLVIHENGRKGKTSFRLTDLTFKQLNELKSTVLNLKELLYNQRFNPTAV
jgi:hypothetical protein